MRNRSAIAQTNNGRTLGRGTEILQQVFMECLGFATDSPGFGMFDLLEGPRRGVQSAPRITTGRKPGPPITDVFEVTRWKKPSF
jgi:hypothetical protein